MITPNTSHQEEKILSLKDRLMSKRAKRKFLNTAIEQRLYELRELERAYFEASDQEEALEDQLHLGQKP